MRFVSSPAKDRNGQRRERRLERGKPLTHEERAIPQEGKYCIDAEVGELSDSEMHPSQLLQRHARHQPVQ